MGLTESGYPDYMIIRVGLEMACKLVQVVNGLKVHLYVMIAHEGGSMLSSSGK